jgi:hypothetical protein
MSACSGGGGGGGGGGTISVDAADTTAMDLMEITAPGPLQSRLVDGHACFWFEALDGTVVSIVWPRGSVARTDPLRVLTGDGDPLAVTADTGLSFGGSFLEGRSGCAGPDSKVFVAGAVSRRR